MNLFTTRNIIRLSAALFIVSLTQKAYCTASTCSDSIMLLLTGWASFLYGLIGFCWLANPLLFVSWFSAQRNPRLALFTSSASFLLAFFFLLVSNIVVNENNGAETIVARKAGYWLWLASHTVMLAGTYREMLILNQKNRKGAQRQKTFQN